MPETIALVNTLYQTPFDAGAEKVVRLLRQGLEMSGATTRSLSIGLPDEATSKGQGDGAARIASANVYFPYPERPHPAAAKALFHLLENWNPVALARVRRAGLLDDATVMFSHNLRGFLTGIWALQNRTRSLIKAHFIHDYQLACTASSMMRDGGECRPICTSCRLFTEGRRRMSAQVDIVYGASQHVLDRHQEAGFFPNALARVIEPPLDLDGEPIRSYVARPVRRFGFLGRLVKEKGIARLLDGFERFRASLPETERPSAELLVAGGGEGPFFEMIRDRIGQLPGARYRGVVTPGAFFAEIDALVVPSTWPDPNPFVVVEAYQHGRPVLGARVGGLAHSIIHGETGLLFDHDAANDGLVSVLSHAWRGMPLSARSLRDKVLQRDYRLAVDTILTDIAAVREKSSGVSPVA